MTDLSIIILNYNTPNLVKQCVKNIKKSLFAVETHNYASLFGDYEIIIVDNDSKEKSRDFLEELRQSENNQDKLDSGSQSSNRHLRIIYSPRNCGFASGHNLGLAASSGRYVLILNPDIVVLNEAILKMRQFMEAHQEIAILGPGLLNPDRTWQYSCHSFPKFWTPLFTRTALGKTKLGKKELIRYNMLDYNHQESRMVDCLFGAALMIRKDFLDKTRGFNEKYFLYYEDIDLCRQAWSLSNDTESKQVPSSNFQVWYLPDAKMIHYHKRLSARRSLWRSIFNKVFWIHISSHLKYFRQWGN